MVEEAVVVEVRGAAELGPTTVTACPRLSLKQLPGGGQAASSWAIKLCPGCMGVFNATETGSDVDGAAKWCRVQGASPKSGAG